LADRIADRDLQRRYGGHPICWCHVVYVLQRLSCAVVWFSTA